MDIGSEEVPYAIYNNSNYFYIFVCIVIVVFAYNSRSGYICAINIILFYSKSGQRRELVAFTIRRVSVT